MNANLTLQTTNWGNFTFLGDPKIDKLHFLGVNKQPFHIVQKDLILSFKHLPFIEYFFHLDCVLFNT